jgi:radical SAM protein with 4Fe4S-binding SPASM domain
MDSGIDELIIALDCLDKDSYREYKGYDGFDQVVKNIKGMVQERGKRLFPFIHLQLIVTRDNENSLDKFINLGKELGADSISFKTVCINLYGFKDKQNYLPTNKRYIRKVYLEDNKASCYKPWISTAILSDGSIVPCCFDMNADIKLGNIFAEDFFDLWNGINYFKFRKQVLKDINSISLCQDCPGKNIPQNFIRSLK